MPNTLPTPRPDSSPVGTDIADQLLDRLSAAGCSEASAIEVLTWAFAATGNTVVVDCARRRGFDLCVSSDDLDAIGRGPLLVKVKRSLAPGTVDRVIEKLAARRGARLGLVVHLESLAEDQPRLGDHPGRGRFPVLVISAQQLLHGVASASFAEVLRDISRQNARGFRAP